MRPRSPLQAPSQSKRAWTSHHSQAINTSRISCNFWTLTTSSSMASRKSWTTSSWNSSSSLIFTGNPWCGTRSYSVSKSATKSGWGDNSSKRDPFKTRIIKSTALGCSMQMRLASRTSSMLCSTESRSQTRSSNRVWCTIWVCPLTYPKSKRPARIMKNATLLCQMVSKQSLKQTAPCVALKWPRRNWWTSISNCMPSLSTTWGLWRSCLSLNCSQSSTLFHKCSQISFSS